MQEVADALRLDTELSADSAAYIEDLYELYLSSPTLVSEDWREYFDKYPKGDQPHGNVREQFLLLGRNANRVQPMVQSTVSMSMSVVKLVFYNSSLRIVTVVIKKLNSIH